MIFRENEDETIEEIPNESILSALNQHPHVQRDEDGFWEYDRESIGFAISFDEDEDTNDHIMVHFPYSIPRPELTYSLAVEFSLWLAQQLGAKVADPQLDEYLSPENIEDGVNSCLEAFRMFEEHAIRRVRKGEITIVGPRRAVLTSMHYLKAGIHEKPDRTPLYIFILIAIFIAIMVLRRLL